jgi:peptidyl-prolyl cis-trans isomerase D
MMKFLRKKGVMKALLWGIAIVVILSFGILSNAYLLTEKNAELKYAGKVWGRKISLEAFQNSYQFALIQAQLQYGENFNQILPMLKLNEQAWDRIILLEEARRQRITVSDKEVVEAIGNIPFFHNQNTGTFDQNIYEMILTRGLRISTRAFEEGMRNSLKISRLFERQTFAVSISEEEIAAAYKEANEQVSISYVLFPVENFINQIVFDEIKAKDYFLNHKSDFVKPPTVSANYITFPFDNADTSSKSQAYEKAFQALNTLIEGNDFLTAAKIHATTVKETGFFDANKPALNLGWPLETLKNLFSMRTGEHTDIITTPNSYDIIQLREIRPAYLPGYEEVKDDVKSAWIKYAAMNLSRIKAEESLTRFTSNNDFIKIAPTLNLTVLQTPSFTRGQYIPDLGPAPAFQQTAFSLTKESPLSGVTLTEKGYAILYLEEIIPIDEKKYEEEKQAFGLQILERKKMAAFDRYFQELKGTAAIEDLISDHLNFKRQPPRV